MKKKLLIIMTVLLAAFLVFGMIACSDYVKPDDDKDDADTITRTQIVTNGTFYNATSSNKDDYLKGTVSGWTATRGSLTTSANGVAMGVVDLSNEESYNLNKDKFFADGNVSNPGIDPNTPFDTDDDGNLTDKKQDSNALVVASKTTAGSLYYKNSTSFTLEAGKYYLLQYSVYTKIDMTDVEEADKAKKGAWVHITGGVEYVDSCINTNEKWETRYLYIEANKDKSISLDVRLWLGNGPETINKKANAYTTKGVAFFDNIICKEVTKASDATYNDGAEVSLSTEEGNDAHKNFKTLQANAIAAKSPIGYESAYYLTDTKLEQFTETTPTTTNAINYYYSFREGVYTSLNTKNFNVVKGKSGLSTSEQPAMSNAYNGMVDFSRLYAAGSTEESKDTYSQLLSSSYKFVAPTYKEWNEFIMNGNIRNINSLDETKALMIFNSDLSGLGFTTKNSVKIEKNKYYRISVWAYVWSPKTAGGEWAWPTADKPEAPKEYTDGQRIIVGYYDGTTVFPGTTAFADYIQGLNEEEEGKIQTAPASVTAVDDINNFANGDTLKADMISAGYDEKVYASFKFYHIYNNFDAYVAAGKLQEGDRNYIEYRYLAERNTFVTGEWKEVNELIVKHNEYNDKLTSYMAKYEVWKNNNEKPYAKVKLTGAGEDIVEKTTLCNEGWEKLTFYVKGNQLSPRNLTMEFWFGEGSATEYENLMFGGVLFDDISIDEVTESDKPDDKSWQVLSPLSSVGDLDFGGLINDENTESYWEYELANKDTQASDDSGKIEITSSEESDIGSIDVNGTTVSLRELIYKHNAATASVLTSKTTSDIKILPNKAYRFAIRVKTEGIEDGKGVTVNLMGGSVDDEKKASVASVSGFNSKEWKEIAFYIMGDAIKTNYVGLQITMGSGSRFDTSSYVKGNVHLAVANCTEIKYSEYNASTKSGDEVKSYSFANTATASESVTNGSFSSIDYASTDDKEFNAEGKLVGVATTSSWTKGTAKENTFNQVELNTVKNSENNYTIKWNSVVGVDGEGNTTKPTHYEVYARFLEGDGAKAKSVERLYKRIDVVDGQTEYSFDVDMTNVRNTSFRVRGVSDKAVGTYSAYKTVGTKTSNTTGNVLVTEAGEVAGKKEIKAGTIANDGSLFSTSDYKSPYDTVMMIKSNYGVALSMSSASKTLSADKYYLVSVWVKTEDGAKAAVTVSNISKVLTADVGANYVGYTAIDTNGSWTQYSFYIKTGASSSSFKLELSLGNPYATKTTKTSDLVKKATATYNDADLSKGTVYFDAVRVLEVKEKEYNEQLAKGEYNEDGSVTMHDFEYLYNNNKYAIKKLVYTIDSFDSFTENTVEEGKDGYNLGNTPNNYEWSKATDATGTTENDRLYGVYNNTSDIEKLKKLYMNENTDTHTNENVFEKFMPENFDIKEFITMSGYNSLVMSNKAPFGQAYTTTSSSTIASKTYYKLSFKAKTMLAKEVKGDDNTKTYTTDGVNAEFRFMQNSSTDKYQSILINSYEEKTYTFYIYNPSSSSSSAKWAFYLGANKDEKDTTGTKQLLMGMMAIDQVELTTITEDEFTVAKDAYNALDDDAKLKASSRVYSYAEDAKTDDDKDKDEDKDKDKNKSSIWDRGDAWLLISSIVIAVAIIVVVIVVLVRRWKKKHPKEVVGENVANPAKDIKVVETPSVEKVDVEEDEEYSDVVKPVYTQRVVKKGKSNYKKPNYKKKK
ncbi:MAG: hypothetical protein MR239_02075 [Clostridiales bacterium]|nr:hypothetical protein [Clostridiales bacterium]